MSRSRRHPALIVAAGATLLTLAAGCDSQSVAEQPADRPADGRLAEYAECLRAQGIDVPEDLEGARPNRSGQPDRSGRPTDRPTDRPSARPSGSAGAEGRPAADALRPDGVDDVSWQQAQDACAASRPQGGRRGDGQSS